MSVYICDVHNNLVWALTIWAVALINEDRIGNIVHDNILEMYIKSSSRWGSKPCFDSNTIRCTAKGATNYSNSWNWLFILVLSKISNADTMARSTSYLVNSNILGSITNGDAIVTCSNIGIGDGDARRMSDVDSIGVRAISGCSNGNMLDLQALTSVNVYVEKFAVLRLNVTNYWICDKIEPYILFRFKS